MMADWNKIRNKYINSTLSTSEIAKLYGISHYSVKEKCRLEHWCDLRKEQQKKTSEKLAEKSAEKIAEKDSDNVAAVRDVTAALLQATLEAVKELNKTTLHHRTQLKKVHYTDDGDRIEKTETREYLEVVESGINIDKVNAIASALRHIVEINALTGGGSAANLAFDELIKAIGAE